MMPPLTIMNTIANMIYGSILTVAVKESSPWEEVSLKHDNASVKQVTLMD